MIGTRAKDSARGQGLMGEEATMDESIEGIEYTAEELREFLAADQLEVHADPRFKERLRVRLWDLLTTARNK